ncbi:MAG: hypothetical protein LUE89_01185 [Clostridiales bacterium]|nr:hypothetical protein [Clostridiales bacterium]
MGKVLVTETHLSAIADAIRMQNGEETTYKPGEMAAAIAALDTTGGAYATGTVTLERTVYSTNALTVTHDLGRMPSFVFAAAVDGWAIDTSYNYTINCGAYINASGALAVAMGMDTYSNVVRTSKDGTIGGSSGGTAVGNITDTTMDLTSSSGNVVWPAGTTVRWFVM